MNSLYWLSYIENFPVTGLFQNLHLATYTWHKCSQSVYVLIVMPEKFLHFISFKVHIEAENQNFDD